MSNLGTPPPSKQAPAPTSTLSLTSLIMGILSWIFLPVVGAMIAVITGHMAKKEIAKSNGLLAGDGMATAGLVIGYGNLLLWLCGCLALLLFPALLASIWNYGDQMLNAIP